MNLYFSVSSTAVMIKGFSAWHMHPDHCRGLLPINDQHITLVGRRILEQLPPDAIKRVRSINWQAIECPEPIGLSRFHAVDGEKESAGFILNNQDDYQVIRDFIARTAQAKDLFKDALMAFHITTHTKTASPRDAVSRITFSNGIYKFRNHRHAETP